MKFVVFNVVVGAALVYLIATEGPPSGSVAEHVSAGTRRAAPVSAQADTPPPAIAPAQAGHGGGADPDPPDRAPERGSEEPPDIVPTDVPRPVPVGREDTELAGTGERASPPALPDSDLRVDGAWMSQAERGRSLREIARDMERRFLTGVH